MPKNNFSLLFNQNLVQKYGKYFILLLQIIEMCVKLLTGKFLFVRM
jgi:hypothetical protein